MLSTLMAAIGMLGALVVSWAWWRSYSKNEDIVYFRYVTNDVLANSPIPVEFDSFMGITTHIGAIEFYHVVGNRKRLPNERIAINIPECFPQSAYKMLPFCKSDPYIGLPRTSKLYFNCVGFSLGVDHDPRYTTSWGLSRCAE